MPVVRVEPFHIAVPDDVLADLHARIRQTRWPDHVPGLGWAQGTEPGYLRELLAYWADGFDWRAREAELNGYPHFRAELDGTPVHFVHERARSGAGVPLVLTHGWPSTFAELLGLVPLLTDPGAHGIAGPGFDVVIPSLPGYAFSPRPPRTGITARHTAGLWHRLMTGLGYVRYGAQGGDFGAAVATHLGLEFPDALLGVHMNNLDVEPYLGPGAPELTEAERAYRTAYLRWCETERGYSAIQSTKPQTVAYGLNDSPAGLAAWITEKWRSWTDSDGDLEQAVPRDLLLTTLTLYWVSGSVGSSMRDYYDNRWFAPELGPEDRVRVPTGVAVFYRNLVDEGTPPREWAQRLYDVHRWTPMPRGGHFAAAEQPELLARDIAGFFAALPSR